MLDVASQLLSHRTLAALGTTQRTAPYCFGKAIEQPVGSRTQHPKRQQRLVDAVCSVVQLSGPLRLVVALDQAPALGDGRPHAYEDNSLVVGKMDNHLPNAPSTDWRAERPSCPGQAPNLFLEAEWSRSISSQQRCPGLSMGTKGPEKGMPAPRRLATAVPLLSVPVQRQPSSRPGIANELVRRRALQPENECEREERRQKPEGAGESDCAAHWPHPQRAAADASVDRHAPDPAHAGGPSVAGPAQHADESRGLHDTEGGAPDRSRDCRCRCRVELQQHER